MRPTLTGVFMIQPSEFEYKCRQFRVDSFRFENLFVDNPRSLKCMSPSDNFSYNFSTSETILFSARCLHQLLQFV